jgi:hypothetical protein
MATLDPYMRARSINEVSSVGPSDFGPGYAPAPNPLPCASPIENVPVEDGAALRELKLCPNRVNVRFFDKRNADLIQKQLQNLVRAQTKQNIDKQDEQALRIIMRGVYLEYSVNGNSDVDGQVAELNRKVLSIIVPQVLSGIAMHVKYLRDISRLPRPLARGQNTSVTGSRSYG